MAMSTAIQNSITGVAGRNRRTWSVAVPAALLSLILLASVANAQRQYEPRISFDGFGTLGVIYSSEDEADFVDNSTRSIGPGHSSPVSASLDSRAAGQVTVEVGSKLTAVVQLMVEQTTDRDYIPSAEWANVRYAFTRDFSMRAGRFAMPAFLISGSRKVSYSNPWIRPPVELYGMIPLYTWDGVDASYRTHPGEWTGSFNAAFGSSRSPVPGGTIKAERLWNVNTTLHRAGLTGRIGGGGGRYSMDLFAPLFNGFRSFGPEGEAIAARFEPDDKEVHFATAGMEYDPGSWFAVAEMGWADLNSSMGEKLAGYITGGYRWGAVTPYATFSRAVVLSESAAAGLATAGLPPPHAQAAAELNAGLNSVLQIAPDQQNLAIGGRWDFMPGVALKAQVEFVNVMGNSRGTYTNLQPDFKPGAGTRLLSVATTFVF
jgi:hypothetical protein